MCEQPIGLSIVVIESHGEVLLHSVSPRTHTH
jgi:hypothetical protein